MQGLADILKYYETQDENNNIKIAKTVIKEILENEGDYSLLPRF